MSETEAKVRIAGADDVAGVTDLFKRTGSPCFCRWWHFEGDKNSWLDRCANSPEDSEAELRSAFREQSPQAQGIVAVAPDGRVVGWMKLTPSAAVAKIYEQKLYRGLPCFEGDRAGVWTLGCLLIDESHRGSGLSGAMVRAGLDMARRAGARAVEAFPRRAEGLAAEEKWTGSFSTLSREGFAVVHEFGPYPVVRCELAQE